MTDIHSHIIYGVDDGSKSIEESIEILKKMKDVGFTDVICTPHFIEDTEYSSENKEKLVKLDALKDAVTYNNLGIKVYLGNEVFINDNVVENIKDNKIYPLNNTKYVLVEFPLRTKLLNINDVLFEIKHSGYIPIIAHPERYDAFKKDYKLVVSLKEDGYLFQCNYSSILGNYGGEAKKLFKRLLKDHYVDYLGTDIHHSSRTFTLDNFPKIIKKITKYAGEDYFKQIMKNCDKLVK